MRKELQRGTKKMLALLTALMLCLLPACAPAEEAQPTPGTLYTQLMLNALAAGREVYGDTSMQISMPTVADVGDDELEVVQAVLDLLSCGSVTYSGAVTAEGFDGRMGLSMKDGDGLTNIADVAISLNGERALLTTSLMPSTALEVRYDEIVQLLGLDQIDWEALGAALGESLAGYTDALIQWAATLPAPVEGGAVAATDTCDAAASTATIQLTGDELAALGQALGEAAKNDGFTSSLYAMTNGGDWSEAVDEAVENWRMSTSGAELELRMLLNDAGSPVAFYLSGSGDVIGLESKTTENGALVRLCFASGGETLFDLVLDVSALLDETFRTDVRVAMVAGEADDRVTLSEQISTEAAIVDGVETITGSDTVESVAEQGTDEAATQVRTTGTYQSEQVTKPVGDVDFETVSTANMQMTVAQDGTELMTIAYDVRSNLASREYVPADLSGMKTIGLTDLLDEATLTSLTAELTSGGMLALSKAMSLLPQETLTHIMELGAALQARPGPTKALPAWPGGPFCCDGGVRPGPCAPGGCPPRAADRSAAAPAGSRWDCAASGTAAHPAHGTPCHARRPA